MTVRSARCCAAIGKEKEHPSEINDFRGILVRVVRLERTVSWSQMRRDTNFATPGYSLFCHDTTASGKNKDFSVCGHSCGQSCFCAVFSNREKPAIACVTRLCGVSPHPIPDTTTALPKQARYQLRYTRIWNDLMGMDPPEATRGRALRTIPVHYNTPAAKREAYSYPFFFGRGLICTWTGWIN